MNNSLSSETHYKLTPIQPCYNHLLLHLIKIVETRVETLLVVGIWWRRQMIDKKQTRTDRCVFASFGFGLRNADCHQHGIPFNSQTSNIIIFKLI